MMLPKEIQNIFKKSKRVCISTGAGMSAESGVPTFRGEEGIWKEFRPEELATLEAFRSDPNLVWGWYAWRRKKILEAKPNAGHLALADWGNSDKRITVVTQNVDDLHRRAGSSKILELHGNIMKSFCMACGFETFEEFSEKVVRCNSCNEDYLRPGVVWFGESLPEDVLQNAFDAVVDCDLFICIGSSNIVYPAASLPSVAKEEGVVSIEINPSETELSPLFDYSLRAKAAELLPEFRY